MTETFESELVSADPAAGGEDEYVRILVRRLNADAREASTESSQARQPWWKRHRVMIPLGVGGLVALTGAALLSPLQLWVGGAEVDLDVQIPIVYTTDTGVEVSCKYGIYFGDPGGRTTTDQKLAEFVQNHDWTGIGQRIYDRAIANPFIPGPDDHWDSDTQEMRDRFSWSQATSLIYEEMPATLLQQAGQSSGATSDCTGQLQ